MDKSFNLDTYSLEELSNELKYRSSKKDLEKYKSIKKVAPGRKSSLTAIPSTELAKAIRGRQKVIYGTDDRKDFYDVDNEKYLKAAQSVVALFESSQIKDLGDGTSELTLENFGDAYNLCQSEKFRNQPIGAFCSGSLVAPQIICTAGHCIDFDNVQDVRFIFGFKMNDPNSPTTIIKNSEIFKGVSIIGRELSDDGVDWALVKLDRPVENHLPVKIRREGKIKDNESLYVIGHPCGLPMKIAPNAVVKDNMNNIYFKGNLDTYGGNSGSPVFSDSNDEPFIEGVLVRGATDFIRVGNCMISNVIPTTGSGGEDITRTIVFAKEINA